MDEIVERIERTHMSDRNTQQGLATPQIRGICETHVC